MDLSISKTDWEEGGANDAAVAGEDDLRAIWAWNHSLPETIEACVHHLIAETVRKQPNAPAICAWDGDMTYQELDRLSTTLSYHLTSLGVGAGDLVPLCFEKSMWTSVAMLGVMKSGAASVALDTTYPEARLKAIVRQSHAYSNKRVVLSSMANEKLSQVLTIEPGNDCAIVVPEVLVRQHNALSGPLATVQPSDTLYVVFTSGSTGTPKGVLISHSNFSSAIAHQQVALGFREQQHRVFDFSSYAFDVAWSNVLYTLVSGGCLCVPNNNDRQASITTAIRTFGATYAHLTPTVGRLLDPKSAPGLRRVMFIGEKLTHSDVAPWSGGATVCNTYGPAECTVTNTIAFIERGLVEPGPAEPGETGLGKVKDPSIGKGYGTITWVVHPTGDALAAIGQPGELWLEGPLVGQGYLGDSIKTAASFINDPPWLLKGSSNYPGRRGRLYRTGDIVFYNPNGSLQFVGRKDEQVKINGQRVELGDVEHHVRCCLTSRSSEVGVVAEIARPTTGSSAALLVVFLAIGEIANRMSSAEIAVAVSWLPTRIHEELQRNLPSHMIPAFYLPIDKIPVTGTGKTNRRRLRDLVMGMTYEKLVASTLFRPQSRRKPATEAERWLQQCWAAVLDVDPNTISSSDSFFHVGGDSIAAIRLVAIARRRNLSFSVADIFRHPHLEDLAQTLSTDVTPIQAITPFSLLGGNITEHAIRTRAAFNLEIANDEIVDVFPCTPLQEGLLALSAKRPGDYISRNIFQLRASVDLRRLQFSWQQVNFAHDILRTRIIDLPGYGLVQVVVKTNPAIVTDDSSLSDYLAAEDHFYSIGLGSPLSHAALIIDKEIGARYFVWTIHHAIFDDWITALLMHDVEQYYNGETDRKTAGEVYREAYGETHQASVPFKAFVQYLSSLDQSAMANYWKAQLKGCEAIPFPTLPKLGYQPRANKTLQYTISDLQWPRNGITPSNILRASWALLQSRYSNTTDVVFGAVVTGRQAPVPGIDRIAGPTIATVPVRIRLDEKNMSISELLLQVQSQSFNMLPYEQFGLSRIARLGDIELQSSAFQTLLVVQPKTGTEDSRGLPAVLDGKSSMSGTKDIRGLFTPLDEKLRTPGTIFDQFNTYALTIVCQLDSRGLDLTLSFDGGVQEAKEIQRLAERLEAVIRRLCNANEGTRISDISTTGKQDVVDIWSWNATVPEAVEACVHDIIAETVQKQPGRPAICAWDGNLTYQQLSDLSTTLARHLNASFGVGPGDLVPLCFEKSVWAPVAMLGVMKAGAASVAMDSTYPEARLRNIIHQAHAHSKRRLVLSSVANEGLCCVLTDTQPAHERLLGVLADTQPASPCTIVVPEVLVRHPVDILRWYPISAQPSDVVYVVFTSGSTGTPKGVVINHRNFSSAIRHQATQRGLVLQSRVLNYSSYAFDAAWSDLLHSLAIGACVCIPSDEERRSDISRAMRSYQANFLTLTPTVERLIRAEDLAGIQTLRLVGEQVSKADPQRWASVQVIHNAYGPAECTIESTFGQYSLHGQQANNIGKGCGAVTWVVHPDGGALVAVGQVGELWLEGPLVGQGYLGDVDRTAAAFIQDPPWLLEGGRRGRLYRTGDLVSYNTDGTLRFVGRKDNQVKVRGQRVELGEVETHIKQALGSVAAQVIVDVISPRGSPNPVLAAFISLPGYGDNTREAVADLTKDLSDTLAISLPLHMIPTTYVPIDTIPTTGTSKTDRKKLRQIGQTVDLAESISSTLEDIPNTPANEIEVILAQVWAEVLNIVYNRISVSAPFTRLGGDSISALHVVSRSRRQGLKVTVSNILRHQTIQKIAPACQLLDKGLIINDYKPEAVVDDAWDPSPIIQQLLERIGICVSNVLDVFPCTPLQDGILLSIAKGTATYHIVQIWKCTAPTASVVVEKLESAWRCVLARHSIFSTLFLETGGDQNFVQVQLRHSPVRICSLASGAEQPTQFLEGMERPEFAETQPPYQVTVSYGLNGEVACRLDIHHALIDAMSMPILLADVSRFYNHDQIKETAPQFRHIVRQIVQPVRSTAKQGHWKHYLADIAPCTISDAMLLVHKRDGVPVQNVTIAIAPSATHGLLTFCQSRSLTRATVIHVAWALVLARITGMRDVCFGYLASGRDIDGAEDLVGPLTNLLVSRVDVTMPASSVLEATAQHIINHLEFQHVSLAQIQQGLGLNGQLLFDTSITVRQEFQTREDDSMAIRFEGTFDEDPNDFAINLSADLDESKTEIYLTYRVDRVRPSLVREAVETFELAIAHLVNLGADHRQDESLYEAFFRYQVGVSEGQAEAVWRNRLEGVGVIMQYPDLPHRNNTEQAEPDHTTEYDIQHRHDREHIPSSRSDMEFVGSVARQLLKRRRDHFWDHCSGTQGNSLVECIARPYHLVEGRMRFEAFPGRRRHSR
ncbi:hypothetical protein EV127DRAFT_231355 [Xylaria flabelliformis]|nr:hypothetical protein EV127DRAFT_231355 [Xylaria flabelliformis]